MTWGQNLGVLNFPGSTEDAPCLLTPSSCRAVSMNMVSEKCPGNQEDLRWGAHLRLSVLRLPFLNCPLVGLTQFLHPRSSTLQWMLPQMLMKCRRQLPDHLMPWWEQELVTRFIHHGSEKPISKHTNQYKYV